MEIYWVQQFKSIDNAFKQIDSLVALSTSNEIRWMWVKASADMFEVPSQSVFDKE